MLYENLNLDLKEFILKSGEILNYFLLLVKKVPKEIDKIKISEIGAVKRKIFI